MVPYHTSALVVCTNPSHDSIGCFPQHSNRGLGMLRCYTAISALLAAKFFADPWFSDGVAPRSVWNPRLFLYQLDRLALSLLNGVSVSWLRETCGCHLASGAVGGLALPWVASYSLSAYVDLCLLLLSFFCYVTIIPYYIFTHQASILGRPSVCWHWVDLTTAGHVYLVWEAIDWRTTTHMLHHVFDWGSVASCGKISS